MCLEAGWNVDVHVPEEDVPSNMPVPRDRLSYSAFFLTSPLLVHEAWWCPTVCLGRNRSDDRTPSSDWRVRLRVTTGFLCMSELSLWIWMERHWTRTEVTGRERKVH